MASAPCAIRCRRACRPSSVKAHAVGLGWILVALAAANVVPAPAAAEKVRPNVVVIVTDDQRVDSMPVLETALSAFASSGTTFAGFVSNSLCCPSRATILTGQYSHSTGVYRNEPPDGGWVAFRPHETSTVATWLHDAGYRTGLIGKYLNNYDVAPADYVPAGWDAWWAFHGPNGAYLGYDVTTNDGGTPHLVTYGTARSDYSTDVIAREDVEFIRSTPADQPLFLYTAPYAPHAPATAAARDVGSHSSDVIAHSPSFNESDVSDKPAYIRSLPPLSPTRIANLDARARSQRESLESVDDLVADVLEALGARVQNTLFIFTSDNSTANGEHRWNYKLTPYSEAIEVPFYVRYDAGGFAKGGVAPGIAANVDIAPTIADFAGVTPATAVDGVSLRRALAGRTARSGLLLEHAYPSRVPAGPDPPSYCGYRSATRLYVRYSTGEEEFYNLARDPFELRNVAATAPKTTTYRDKARALCRPLPPGMTAF